MYSDKKNQIEEIFVSEKCLILSLTVIFEEHTFGDLACQTTWISQEYYETIPPIYACVKVNKDCLMKNIILDHIENDGRRGLCNNYHFNDKVTFLNHFHQGTEKKNLINYVAMQFLHIHDPNEIKPPKNKEKSKF